MNNHFSCYQDSFQSRISLHISDDNLSRVHTVFGASLTRIPHHLQQKVFVNVRSYNRGNQVIQSHLRSLPNMKPVGDLLGNQFFRLAGAAVAVGYQAYSDAQREDLTGSQKLGRSSVALLGAAVPPLGYFMLGYSIVFPHHYDQLSRDFFSEKNPVVDGLGTFMYNHGGDGFRNWLERSTFLDYW